MDSHHRVEPSQALLDMIPSLPSTQFLKDRDLYVENPFREHLAKIFQKFDIEIISTIKMVIVGSENAGKVGKFTSNHDRRVGCSK